jgi:peptidoglycan/xylan/chitin deacetylase (PgdA/CDA1 family)
MLAILTYHSIDRSGSPISVSPEQFRAHVKWFASGRVRVVPLRDVTRMSESHDAVALTFDDGFVNFADVAAPLLREHGLPATLFVATDHVGATNEWGGVAQAGIPTLPLLDWDALAVVAQDSVEIGAHSRRHPHLATVAAEALPDEIVGSANAIEQRVGRRPRTFAYPYGSVSDEAARIVRAAFDVGCTTVLSAVRDGTDPARLPRLDMFYLRDAGRLESWGSPSFRRRLWIRAQARRVRQYVASSRDLQ